MQISELARRVGVSTHVLRAWEQRYGLLRPQRTSGGYRLYGPEDQRRVQAVLRLRAEGVSVAEASAHVLAAERSALADRSDTAPAVAACTSSGAGRSSDLREFGAPTESEFVSTFLSAAEQFDDAAAHAALDRLLRVTSLPTAIDHAIVPFLRELGERWAAGTATVANEHFITQLLRHRLAALIGPGRVAGPLVVLAAPSEEYHDLILVCFAALLSRGGWRTRLLGANTPVQELAAASIGADLIIVAATRADLLLADAVALRRIAKRVPLALCGRGATQQAQKRTGGTPLPDSSLDAVGAAETLALSKYERRLSSSS